MPEAVSYLGKKQRGGNSFGGGTSWFPSFQVLQDKVQNGVKLFFLVHIPFVESLVIELKHISQSGKLVFLQNKRAG